MALDATRVVLMARMAVAVASDRIVEVLDTESSVVPPVRPVTSTPERGTVRFEGVGFTYPGASSPVLGDISFDVEPGRTTAIN